MKNYFIINPASGRGESMRFIPDIEAFDNTNVFITSQKGEASVFVKKIADSGEVCRFYAVGGDGTLNEVINGAYGYKNAQVGLIPCGTGNDFVRCFKNKEDFTDIAAQLNGMEEPVDTIEASFDGGEGIYFINMANIGFDCNVVINTNTIKKKYASGSAAYIMGLIQELSKDIGQNIKIKFDDGDIYDGCQLLCTIANGMYCGGGFFSSPNARLSDGYIDVAVIHKMKKLKILSLLKKYRDGTYMTVPGIRDFVTYKKTTSLIVEMDKEQGISVDGEIYFFKTAEFINNKNSISFIIPQKIQKGANYENREHRM